MSGSFTLIDDVTAQTLGPLGFSISYVTPYQANANLDGGSFAGRIIFTGRVAGATMVGYAHFSSTGSFPVPLACPVPYDWGFWGPIAGTWN